MKVHRVINPFFTICLNFNRPFPKPFLPMCDFCIHLREPLAKVCGDLTECSSKIHLPYLRSIFLSKTKSTGKTFLNRLNLETLVTVYNQNPRENWLFPWRWKKIKWTLSLFLLDEKSLFILRWNKTKQTLTLRLLDEKYYFYH
jgi:hypothetical protein